MNPETTPLECEATLARLQALLDGDSIALEGDAHARSCAPCRERVRAAKLLLAALTNSEPALLPPHFADRVLAQVAPAAPRTRRWQWVAVGVGIAAAVLLAMGWLRTPPVVNSSAPEMVQVLPTEQPARPLRIADELAKAGQAIQNTTRPITEVETPRMFAALSSSFTRRATPATVDLEPARRSLSEIPDAARAGLEPVAGSASKAFARLIRDVSAVSPSKPKS